MSKTQQQLPLDLSELKRKPAQVVSMDDLVEGQGKKGARPVGFLVRFFQRFKKGQNDECWPWTGCRDARGYGKISIGTKGKNRKLWLAHRVAYIIHFGSLPEDREVCHKCDNPPCVNPNHFFLGTHQDNFDDAANKNRLRFGSSHHNTKLIASDVIEIQKRYTSGGVTQAELASEYGISQPHCSKIISGSRRSKL